MFNLLATFHRLHWRLYHPSTTLQLICSAHYKAKNSQTPPKPLPSPSPSPSPSPPKPPNPPKKPATFTLHDISWEDPYSWMSSLNDKVAMRNMDVYMEQEEKYTEAVMADSERLQSKLQSEMAARFASDLSTPPLRWGPWLYYRRVEEGKQYPVLCRRLASLNEEFISHKSPSAGFDFTSGKRIEQKLLDYNQEAERFGGFSYEELSEVSPDHRFLAYTMYDKDNDYFKLSVRDLNFGSLCCKPQADRVSNLAWAKGGQALLYVITDQNKRPYRIYCSMLGSNEEDVLLLDEPTENVYVNIRHTKDFRFVTVNTFSTTSSKVFLINAADPLSGLTLVWECEASAHCIVEHHQGYLFLFTNAAKDQPADCHYLLCSPVHTSAPRKWESILIDDQDIVIEDVDLCDTHLVVILREGREFKLCSVALPLPNGKPVVEFIFAATEEAIFVHVLISAKHIRALSSSDMEKIQNDTSNYSGDGLPVIASPHGMRGRISAFCSSDLVKQVYLSSGKFKTSNGIVGLPHDVSQSSGCQLSVQSCYVEVTLGFPPKGNNDTVHHNSSLKKNLPKHHTTESSAMTSGVQKGLHDQFSLCERTFIYPVEAVIVPVLQTSFARSSLKRFWMQNWIGPSLSGSPFFMHCVGERDSVDGSWIKANGFHSEQDYHSSSNSISSSISSISGTSSDSELEADADSLTCGQSGLSSCDQLPNNGSKSGSKRHRTGMGESFGQAALVTNGPIQGVYKSDYGSLEVNNSSITGVANDVGSHWDWEDDNRGMDIQALLSEFGDFGDFFENDSLPFGEPPGTAESQALMFSIPDSGDLGSSPNTGIMDVADQMLLPVGFPSFDNVNQPPVAMEEIPSKTQEVVKNAVSSGAVNNTPASSFGEFDHLVKAEALMTFAPEYGAIETVTSDFSTSIFSNPYIPKSRKDGKVESTNSSPESYVYTATPPSSPCLDGSDEKHGVAVTSKACSSRQDSSATLHSKKYYTVVERGKEHDKRSIASNNNIATVKVATPSSFSRFNYTNSVKSGQKKTNGATFEQENFQVATRTVLATEVECFMFQASMCRIRHTLMSSCSLPLTWSSRLTGNSFLNQVHGEQNTATGNVFGKYEVKKKESIPVRIAGDIDSGLLEGPLNAPVGVWRSVGVPKVAKPTMSPSMEICPSLPSHSSEEGILSYGQRQPLLEFLDGLALLVQQATSFVDVALDADCGDGPYGWLALQEQWRRGLACGPFMVHAGCGGSLASCHSLDIAGVELVDPLLADVHASSVIGLLQSDIKTALGSSFGTLDGPLSVTEWCKGRSGDAGTLGDGFASELTGGECRDSSSTVTLPVGESLSPSQSSSVGSLGLKGVGRVDEASQWRANQETCASDSEQQLGSRLRPTLFVLPAPAILVGYQDDWLKTSASSLQLWEKAPLEPYALQKHMSYYVVCPDIDPLTTAAADFFQQLSTVYETCKLGTHSPQSVGSQMEIDSGKWSSSGFILLDCPQSMKIESSTASLVGSISDYFLSLSNGWDLTSFLKSLSKVLKALNLGSCFTSNPKEGNTGPCMVIYVVCPFPEPVAVLQTVIESSIAVGSVILSKDKEKRSLIHNQVGKALSCSASADEASISNVLTLPGFCIPKLVLQIVTVDAIFRVTSPALNELVILKEISFTVYNKARRISRGSSTTDLVQASSMSSRSHSASMQITSPVPGMWKECSGPRITGPRESELDPTLRHGSWDNNTWQSSRAAGGFGIDPHRTGDFLLAQDETRYMFEPLFILAEPGSLEHGVSPTVFTNIASESSKPSLSDDCTSGSFVQISVDATTPSSQSDRSETADGFGSSGHQKTLPSLHCCYGWTEDWRWLVCVWTDSRGELLDSHIFPFGGISSRQDTKGLQSLFVQMLQQGSQILQACSSPDSGVVIKPRDFVITRIGCFYELEYQEWQKALYSVGGCEVKKWPLQLRRSAPDGMLGSSNGTSLQQEQEMSLIQERTLPSSPSPLYSGHSKASGFVKGGGLGQSSARKPLMGGPPVIDHNRGLLQWVQSISFISISVDHSLHLVFQADSASPGGAQSSSSTVNAPGGYIEGFTPVKSLGSASTSYVLIPSPSMRFLPPTPLQLPTCLTAESPPLAHLLHSKGSTVPLSTGFVVSKAVPSMGMGKESSRRSNLKEEEWPSVISVSLVDHYGNGSNNNINIQEKTKRGIVRSMLSSEARDFEIEAHLILESVAAELHALSWMSVSPAYLERRTALPFHCDMVLRLRRLLHFADKELSQSRRTEKTQV